MTLWLALFAVALALPPAFAFFFVPGYWSSALNGTAYLSPVLALSALVLAARRRATEGASKGRAAVVLSLIALTVFAAWVTRAIVLLSKAV